MHRLQNYFSSLLLALAICAIPGEAAAYIDPGTSGMISQVLYVLFYGVLGVFFYYLKYIRSSAARLKIYFAGLFNRQT